MAEPHPRPWEPEEAIGSLWHRLVGDREPSRASNLAAVTLEEMRPRMGIMLRGLGGDPGSAFAPLEASASRHRRSILQIIGHAGEKVVVPYWDGETLNVSPALSWSDDARLNAATYLWLAAWAALYTAPSDDNDVMRRDLMRLRAASRCRSAVLKKAPGLLEICSALDAAALAERKTATLPPAEAQVENIIRHLLGRAVSVNRDLWQFVNGEGALADNVTAPSGYRAALPVFHWPQWLVRGSSHASPRDDAAAAGSAAKREEEKRKRAHRRASDQASRRDPLILHRFETIKTWAEIFNLGRKVEDDDPDNARKAADDQDELGLGDTEAKPSTRIAFDLDLSPQELDRVALGEGTLLPEWDWRRNQYLPDHVRLLCGAARQPQEGEFQEISPVQARLVAGVRRQFEGLVPRHCLQSGEDAGSELDLEAVLRMTADRRAGVINDGRIFRALRPMSRDLAVLTLADVSRSTEGIAEERSIIDIAKETLLAMAHGLAATGDAHAISTFSSVRRSRVFYDRVKGFSEPMDAAVTARICALRPGHYTRLGAAIRQAAKELRAQGALRRLLLVVTDGKPNDIDHYEGRFGIEDTRRAVLEARMSGLAVFAITIDRRAEAYVPYIFGRNGFHIVSHPSRLAEALPGIYRHLVG